MKSTIIIISKGRIFNETIIYLYYKKIKIKNKIKKTRKLFLKTNKKNIFIIIIKNIDINKYIKKNNSDLSIIGKDLIIEKKINYFYKYYNLNISKCKLSILINKNFFKKNKKLATKYKKITNEYFKYKSLNIKIIKVNSSIEIFLIFKITNIITDIIASNKTIKINKIFEIKNIIKINAIIIFNRKVIKRKLKKYFFYFLYLKNRN